MWETIASICAEHGYRLTVYIDDVTISGASVSGAVVWQIKHAIHRAGLRYHKEKTFIDQPAEITGVIVAGGQLRVPNRQLKKLHGLKASLRAPLSQPEGDKLRIRMAGLQGQISQIEQVARV